MAVGNEDEGRRLPFADVVRRRSVDALLDTVLAGGPFASSRDGSTSRNGKGRLPSGPLGSYREFTVLTPGTRGRGARRVVIGQTGATYDSDDHYRSFVRIEGERR